MARIAPQGRTKKAAAATVALQSPSTSDGELEGGVARIVPQAGRTSRPPSHRAREDPLLPPAPQRRRVSPNQRRRGQRRERSSAETEKVGVTSTGAAFGEVGVAGVSEEVGVAGASEEWLRREARAIELDIRASKLGILRSALKKERIELLRRKTDTRARDRDWEERACSNHTLQLDRKIAKEKRRLLKLAKEDMTGDEDN